MTGFKLNATTRNDTQQRATGCKRTQHVTSTNVGCCWPTIETDTFGPSFKCPSWRDVRLVESQIKGIKKTGTISRCPSRESGLYNVFCSIFVKTVDETTNIQFHTALVFNLLPRLYLRLIKIYWCIYVVVHSWTFIFFSIFFEE